MSGIVGSKLNTRGSGHVAKLGTDGQVLTSSGAGTSAVYEDASGGTSWQSVTTGSTLTAVAGNGYPINTTSNACTVTLPAGNVGDTIEFVDYAGTFDTNKLTLTANGSEKINGSTLDFSLNIERQGIKIVYVDATQGWEAITGANETAPALTPPPYSIEWLVIGGGGGGGTGANSGPSHSGGAGGAGGYRNSYETTGGGGTESNTNLDDLAVGIQLTMDVGAGGAGGVGASAVGTKGQESSIKGTGIDITSDGGGYGAYAAGGTSGGAGGSGGGAGADDAAGGAGTTNQGFAGGTTSAANTGGGGGGASEAGDSTGGGTGVGGAGVSSAITGSAVTRAGGGGGYVSGSQAGGAGGGGAGSGTNGSPAAVAGTANTGGGGGTSHNGGANPNAAAGGSGVIILRMPDANYSGTITGSPTVATGVSGNTILTFTGDGTYTT